MEYEKMLDRLYLSLPKEAMSKERFEVPLAESFIQGNKTIVRNLQTIVKSFRREEGHMVKFLTKELGAPMNVEEGRLFINSKFGQIQIQKAIQEYANQYVLCHECKKPDTVFSEKQGVKVLKCTACGAVSAIKRL
ncbi:MAG: translation initiation factor IF-2 subunit beta [Candidatus Diapherotrites archaeon]